LGIQAALLYLIINTNIFSIGNNAFCPSFAPQNFQLPPPLPKAGAAFHFGFPE